MEIDKTFIKPSVLVLMCTYNGEEYLREQIDSIFAQEGVSVFLRVCDDCSKDKTVEILEEYAQKYPKQIQYSVNQKNKNFTYNFLDNIFSARKDTFDYYALADQDDVWKKDKLVQAIKQIQSRPATNKKGVLYCSNQEVVDENLKFQKLEFSSSPVCKNRYVYLLSNIATGCTMVFDNQFKNTVCSYYPRNLYMHDYWLFLIGVFVADWVYDEKSYILYRQHGNNQIGAVKDNLGAKSRIERYKNQKGTVSSLCRLLLEGFGSEMNKKDRRYIKIVAGYQIHFSDKLKALLSPKLHIVSKGHFFRTKIRLLTNKI